MTYLMKNGCHGNQNQQIPKCVMALVPWKPLFMQLMSQEKNNSLLPCSSLLKRENQFFHKKKMALCYSFVNFTPRY